MFEAGLVWGDEEGLRAVGFAGGGETPELLAKADLMGEDGEASEVGAVDVT